MPIATPNTDGSRYVSLKSLSFVFSLLATTVFVAGCGDNEPVRSVRTAKKAAPRKSSSTTASRNAQLRGGRSNSTGDQGEDIQLVWPGDKEPHAVAKAPKVESPTPEEDEMTEGEPVEQTFASSARPKVEAEEESAPIDLDDHDAAAEIDVEQLAGDLTKLSATVAAASDEPTRRAAINQGMTLAQSAVEADQFALASKALDALLPAARPLGDRDQMAEINRMQRSVEEMARAYERAEASLEQLKANDDDAEAHWAVGRYYCFAKGNWKRGLPHLAAGSNEAARDAAAADLKRPGKADDQIALGDSWRAVAGKLSSKEENRVLLRARAWYKRGVGSLEPKRQAAVRETILAIERRTANSFTAEAALAALESASLNRDDRLSPTEQARMQTLLGEFRGASGTVNPRRDAIVKRLVKMGGPALSQLLTAVNKEMRPQLQAYGEEFQRQAERIASGRTGGNVQEIESLREQVLALRKRDDLTKEMIVAEGDPAMKKLHDLLVVEPKTVLESSSALQQKRKSLLKIGAYWEYCTRELLTQARLDEIKRGDGSPKEAVSVPSFEEYLLGEEDMSAKLAMKMDPSSRSVLEANAKLAPQLDQEAARAILACNLTRQLLGLRTLEIDLKLCEAAKGHSTDMKTLNFFAHESPVEGKKSPSDRAKLAGTSCSGENIAVGYADGNKANMAWFHSPGHHKNMLGGHRRIGLGVNGVHYTEMFGG